MRKIYLPTIGILAVLGLSIAAVAKPSLQEQAPQTARHDEDWKNEQAHPPKAVSIEAKKDISPRAPTTEEANKRIAEDPPETDWWSRIANAFIALGTLALAVIGAIAARAAIRTLRAIERQTSSIHHQAIQVRKQTRLLNKSAEAARTSANAFLDSERAWLVPAAESIQPNDLPTRVLNNSQVETIRVRIENCGRTPAWVMDYFIEAAVLDDTNIGQFTNAGRPEGDFPNARPFPQGRTEDFSFEWTTNRFEIDDVKSGRKQLYIYGFLQYRSIVGDEPRVSHFCFHYFHKRNSIGNFEEGWAAEPPEENHYT